MKECRDHSVGGGMCQNSDDADYCYWEDYLLKHETLDSVPDAERLERAESHVSTAKKISPGCCKRQDVIYRTEQILTEEQNNTRKRR